METEIALSGNKLISWEEREIAYATDESDYDFFIQDNAKKEELRKKKINQIKKAIEIENEKEEAKGPIVFISDPNEMARFPGNYPSSLFDWVERNKSIIQYHGRVGVQFVVECDGSLSNIKITRHSMAADEDIIRLVKKMPKWIPAHQDGKAVRSIVNINLDI